MNATPDLLTLRLDALELDIEKVRVAVSRAQDRGHFLEEAGKRIAPCIPKLRKVQRHLGGLITAMEDDAVLMGQVAELDLDHELKETPQLVEDVLARVRDTIDGLGQAMITTVTLTNPALRKLEASLNRRCREINDKLEVLKTAVAAGDASSRRAQWSEYQALLDGVARPVFAEYVDFLGGLTVRDTGLDDRVCDMTDALLSRYKTVTDRSLPLPARQAALGNALDSVVMLGFPEWSIWGIPLVGHEVGLAYARDRNDPDRVQLIRKYWEVASKRAVHLGTGGGALTYTEAYVQQLLADAFGAYTLGLSFACASLLLRLNPRHDEPPRADQPRDIDRARVIMMTISAGGGTAPHDDGTFSDAVGRLREIWEAALRAHAGPGRADAAAAEAVGPAPHEDWLDDFTRDAVALFGRLKTIRAYDDERWQAAEVWWEALRSGTLGPGWEPVDDAVPDVLTAAWRLRLIDGKDPNTLAADVKQRWSESGKGS